ncbi:hypothetical protein Cfor_04098, partial [Coptotermes formosanus]
QRSPAESIEDIRYFHSQESNTIQCIKWTNYSVSWTVWEDNVGRSAQLVFKDANTTVLQRNTMQMQ